MNTTVKATLFVLSLSVFGANASGTNYRFVKANDAKESDVCVVAATEGYSAARKFASHTELSNRTLTCNGLSLKAFAKKYAQPEPTSAKTTVQYVLKALNDNSATQTCIDAATKGIGSLKSADAQGVVCNGMSIARFAKAFRNK